MTIVVITREGGTPNVFWFNIMTSLAISITQAIAMATIDVHGTGRYGIIGMDFFLAFTS